MKKDKYLEVVNDKDFRIFGLTKEDILEMRRYFAIKNIRLPLNKNWEDLEKDIDNLTKKGLYKEQASG